MTAETRNQLEQRRDRWVAELVTDAPLFGQPEEIAWFQRIDDNLSAVRATLQHCLVEQPDSIGAFVAPKLHQYWNYRGMLVEWERWTRLAALSPTADPFDRLLASCCHTIAANRSSRGQLSRQWMTEFEAYPDPLSREQKVWLVHFLVTFLFASYLADADNEGLAGALQMRRLADETGDPTADLLAQVGHVLSVSRTAEPSTLLPDIDAIYRRAQTERNHFAVWVTAAAGMISSAVGLQPEVGIGWSDVLLKVYDTLHAVAPPSAVEIRGLLQAAAGHPYPAVQTIVRSRTLARRTGDRWPLQHDTPQVLVAAQSQLTPSDAERAYQDGLLSRT